MFQTHLQEVEAILGRARAERRLLLEQVSESMRASLPVDATGITQAIEHLGAVMGVADELRAAQERGYQANPAVLHGRVFGRAPLPPETVLAAFADAARIRAAVLVRLAEAIGGHALGDDIAAFLDAYPSPDDTHATDAKAVLRETYAAQEGAVVRIAVVLDGATVLEEE